MSIHNVVILTGAGFSVPWGGVTATELSVLLFNAATDRAKDVREALLLFGDYEVALDHCSQNPHSKALFLETLVRQFKVIDKRMHTYFLGQLGYERHLAMYFRDWSENVQNSSDSCLLVSLNQDLGLERFWWCREGHGVRCKKIPEGNQLHFWGVGSWRGQDFQPYTSERTIHYPANVTVRDADPGICRLLPGVNYLKLHGSMNWIDQNGRPLLITGSNKPEQCADFPVLDSMQREFGSLSELQDLRFICLGYSFRDDHVNRVLRKACEDNGAKIMIVSPNAKEICRKLWQSEGWDVSAFTLIESRVEDAFSYMYGSGGYNREQRSAAGPELREWIQG